MSNKAAIVYGVCLLLGCGSLTFMQTAHAFNPMNMMNPSKWFGGKNRQYDDYYEYGPYGDYGPYGGGPGWGPGGPGVAPGYGGYGPGGYGYGGVPPYGYGAVPPAYGYTPTPSPTTTRSPTTPTYSTPPKTSDKSREIKELEDRIRKLEASQNRPPPPLPSIDRGMGGYTGSSGYQDESYPRSGGYQGGGYQSSSPPRYRPLGQ